jgi:hypothetical protein
MRRRRTPPPPLVGEGGEERGGRPDGGCGCDDIFRRGGVGGLFDASLQPTDTASSGRDKKRAFGGKSHKRWVYGAAV